MRYGSSLVAALLLAALSPARAEITFKRTQIDDKFRSEGVAAGDFNRDGKLDIAAGSVYFAAPDWKMHPIVAQPPTFDPKSYSDTFCNFAEDFDGDGWTDLLVVGFPGKETRWYRNSQGLTGEWKMHIATRVTNNESPQFLDIDGDQRRELLAATNPDPANADGPQRFMALIAPADSARAPWNIRRISAAAAPGTMKYSHGIGAGDINGDGRLDVLCTEGWWEAPAAATEDEWKFHPARLGEACSQMFAYDFDGDGDADVLSASAHKFGIWWHEQTPDGWQTHEISKSFSQTHAVNHVDMNGDGLPDIVTGKRWWAHAAGDPGVNDPPVLYWLELKRENGKPTWIEHQIDDNSGVGTQFEVIDMNGDGLLDIISSNKRGTFYFEQVRN